MFLCAVEANPGPCRHCACEGGGAAWIDAL